MPLCTEPGQKLDYIFPCDRDKPKATRPTVICKALSQRDGSAWFGEVLACTKIDEADAKIAEALIGVTNMGTIKDVPAMLRSITADEREDLVVHVSRGKLTEDQRKNF